MDLLKKISPVATKINIILKKKEVKLAILFFIIILIPMFFLILAKDENVNKKNIVENVEYFKAPYVPDELIVRLKDEYTADNLDLLDKKFKELGVLGQNKAYTSDKPYLSNYYILKFKSGTDIKSAKKALDSTGMIEVSHPNYLFFIQETPNDPYLSSQWDLAIIGMPEVWNLTQGSNNIKVAVIDTGIDYNHPDFSGRSITRGLNYANCPGQRSKSTNFCLSPPGNNPIDDHGHGTHVAGTIGAITNNGVGIAGMSPNITLMAIKSMRGDGGGTLSDNVNAMQYAIDNGAKIINMSLSSGREKAPPCSGVPELQETINDAVSRGMVVVVAAGNENQDASSVIPPSCNGVIVVGATNSSDQRWIDDNTHASNFGSVIDLSAPGAGIISPFRGGYSSRNGTSMAAPHVAAAAAILLSLKPQLTVGEIRECLVASADPITTDRPIGKRLNLIKAVKLCAAPPIPINNPLPTQASNTLPQPGSGLSTGQGGTTQKISPTPGKTYTCKQAKGPKPNGAIQIGNLVCTPNP